MTRAELEAHYSQVATRLGKVPPKALWKPRKPVKPVAVLVYHVPIGPERPIGCAKARRITKLTAQEYGVHFIDLISERRDKQSVLARHCAMWRIKRALPWSMPRIGRAFGGRDHTTALNAIRRHQARIDAGEVMP